MESFLSKILEHKREEVRKLRRDPAAVREGRTSPRRPFCKAIDNRPALSVIAEIKKASPSKGLIAEKFDPLGQALRYEEGGADALSVLTDSRFFGGSLDDLAGVRKRISLPVLRKDFIIDPIQVEQSVSADADCLLLIVAALSDSQLAELYAAAMELGIDPLIEVHSAPELDRALKLSPSAIGINNRNLDTFEVSLQTTLDLVPQIPPTVAAVSESGIFSGQDSARAAKAGASAVLVGEALMKAQDPGKLIAEFKRIP
jgi:indole-3-glycerol phosphate synthase